MIEITFPEGRIVSGHPMRTKVRTDDNSQPKLDQAGNKQHETYLAVALAKTGETDWRQTPWGQQIAAEAKAGWPNGEHQSPSFAWKVTDGDSMVPNKRGKKPAEREGWAGCWVVHMATTLGVTCYKAPNYAQGQELMDPNAIKTGDYARVSCSVKANAPSPSPGVYINPELVSLEREGPAIKGERPDAEAVFGNGAAPAQQPQPAHDLVQNAGAPAGPAPAPAAEKSYQLPDGKVWPESALRNAGYTDAHLAALPVVA